MKTCNLKFNLIKGTYRYEWVNTLNGIVEMSGIISHNGGEITFNSPVYTEDIALRIKTI